jgi:segregation and condensation protein B
VESDTLQQILEAALLAAGKPLSMDRLMELFEQEARPGKDEIREALEALAATYDGRGIEVKEVSSGFRIQVRSEFVPWVSRLWEERPGRYSRALMETLALIAYRQPITRGEIEDIRGVSVSTHIIRTLTEREWVRVVGHRDVPGKPSLYATTRAFLDYFGLKGLDELPTLAQIRDLDSINQELDLVDIGAGTETDAGDQDRKREQTAGTAEAVTQRSAEIIPLSPREGEDDDSRG